VDLEVYFFIVLEKKIFSPVTMQNDHKMYRQMQNQSLENMFANLCVNKHVCTSRACKIIFHVGDRTVV